MKTGIGLARFYNSIVVLDKFVCLRPPIFRGEFCQFENISSQKLFGVKKIHTIADGKIVRESFRNRHAFPSRYYNRAEAMFKVRLAFSHHRFARKCRNMYDHILDNEIPGPLGHRIGYG